MGVACGEQHRAVRPGDISSVCGVCCLIDISIMVATIKRASDGEGLQWEGKTDYTLTETKTTMDVGDQTNTTKIAAEMQRLLQADMDTRVLRSTLPDDEETKKVDPARDNFFWDGDYIVARSNIITVVYIDGKYIPTVRVA